MILTRFAARIVKPLWSSISPHYSNIGQLVNCSYRTITTGRDHLRFAGDASLLDPFIGKWTETSTIVQQLIQKYEGVGSVEELNVDKTWISFARDGDEWTCVKGFVNNDDTVTVKFKLNEPNFVESDGVLKKHVVLQEGKKMIERSAKFGDPAGTSVIVREVENKKMTAKYSVKGEPTITRIFNKV